MSERGLAPDPAGQRPIATRDSVWIEELTWMEVRDALASGKKTVIVPTGGVEQNGPYVAAGKHNLILRATAEAIARKLGDALVAPIIPFVPEGQIDPPTSHMRYPSTISLEESTYQALLKDIARSLHAHGFRNVIFIGDSKNNQDGMNIVAKQLDDLWRTSGDRALFVPEYYDWDDRSRWLRARGFQEVDEGIHDELSVESIIMAVDPTAIRLAERQAAGRDSINRVKLAPPDSIAKTGRELVQHIADVTVAAIQRQLQSQR
ncbi:creatininase family protein [Sphingomonas sp. G124]|uniref:Creatininase family protein n=1 Tax=Sphingomonas cremea TaxID=2904799 RepID=A0A9X1QLQ9_9SPHN|nr:creatininase family protein [Sphingomonas cremea]MCF2514844.1 creatininase family protein [Sphingomonas cremea]